MVGLTTATVPGKKEKQQNELKNHYLEFQGEKGAQKLSKSEV